MNRKLRSIVTVFSLFLFLETTRAYKCPPVQTMNAFYVGENPACNEVDSLEFHVFEDTPAEYLLFRVDEDYSFDDCDGFIFQSGSEFGFMYVGDAENPPTVEKICYQMFRNTVNSSDTTTAYFVFLDVNEFSPQPANGLEISQSIEVNENTNGTIHEFSYTDPDVGEASTLTCIYNFEEPAASIFEIVQVGPEENVMKFRLNAKENLDYETNNFFSLKALFQSEDLRGNSSSVEQSFLVFVQDVGDNPPFFTILTPFASTPEGSENETIFEVQARDGDIAVNNRIMYSIVAGNDDDYFTIDPWSGEVYPAKVIDRETLDTTLFPLEIQAQEVDEDGIPIADQLTASQVTNVNILDVNDNIPIFSNESFSITIEEFDDNNPTSTKTLDTLIVVSDMDEGLSGQYEISTSNPNVLVNPTSGSGETSIGITLKKSDDFDYEHQSSNPKILVTITATEQEDNSHSSSLVITFILTDINDNIPQFEEEQYTVNVNETIEPGSPVITVTATDNDASDEYNENYLVYSISGCNEFIIDEQTGVVLLSESASLDYEEITVYTCTVSVQDMNGTSEDSLQSEASLTITVLDVNDELPIFENFEDSVEVLEGTSNGTEIIIVEIIDYDTTASLLVTLTYSGDPGSDVESWFELVENEESTINHYVGTIVVNQSPDREIEDEVVVILQAQDTAAQDGIQITEESLTIRIKDINDETPTFQDDYSRLNYAENSPEGLVVLRVQATDDDLDDQLLYTLNDELNYLQINETTGEVSVKTEVDREETQAFIVTLSVQDLVNHTQTIEISVTVDDVNDNAPVLNSDICYDAYVIREDARDGTILTTVQATDADAGIHAEISYVLDNLNVGGSTYQFAPFIIDQKSGDITVNTSGNLVLDRELRSEWELFVYAIDSCDITEPTCKVHEDECVISVTVEDVNDNPPKDYESNKEIVTDEFLLKDAIIDGVEISALDPDEPNTMNSKITFEVMAMWKEDGTPVVPLFESLNNNRTSPDDINEYYCNLRAITDLTGLRGEYTILLEGTDYGDEQLTSEANFTVIINDANDMSPKFTFSDCLLNNDMKIDMTENITALNVPLNCSSDGTVGRSAVIYVTDDDEPNTPNSEVDLSIDLEKSSAVDGGTDNQLEAFYIYYYPDDGIYGIAINEKIDREKGSQYNLSLLAKDNGEEPQTSYSWIFITVKDFSEYPPTFCDVAPCQQSLFIKENSNLTTMFKEAEDKDNSVDVVNDIIYYSIISSDVEAFMIPDTKSPGIRPKTPLDREQLGTYELQIMASNEINGPPVGIEDATQVLKVSVVILDENDETPNYDNIIYGDFLDTGITGDQVAVIEFTDKDLNDTITYSFGSTIQWNDGQNYAAPFSIGTINERISEIILEMDPKGTYGYCTFTIIATDAVNHSSSAVAQVFVVTGDFIVPFIFFNDIDDVEKNKENIAYIFTNVFNYTGVVDSIEPAKNSNNEEIEGQTVLSAHFIRELAESSTETRHEGGKTDEFSREQRRREFQTQDKEKRRKLNDEKVNKEKIEAIRNNKKSKKEKSNNGREENEFELVPKHEIEELGSKGTISSALDEQLTVLGLNLVRIGDTNTGAADDSEQKIINLKIAVGTVSLCLGLVVIMLITMFFVRTTKLKRQIKVLSTSSYGEMSSGLDKEGPGAGQVPGSNLFAMGQSNPFFNFPDESLKEISKDTESWDSVLVGVEDNPQFSDYLQKRAEFSAKRLSEPREKVSIPGPSTSSLEKTEEVKNDIFNDVFEPYEVEFVGSPAEEQSPPSRSSRSSNSIEAFVDTQINSQFIFK